MTHTNTRFALNPCPRNVVNGHTGTVVNCYNCGFNILADRDRFLCATCNTDRCQTCRNSAIDRYSIQIINI